MYLRRKQHGATLERDGARARQNTFPSLFVRKGSDGYAFESVLEFKFFIEK